MKKSHKQTILDSSQPRKDIKARAITMINIAVRMMEKHKLQRPSQLKSSPSSKKRKRKQIQKVLLDFSTKDLHLKKKLRHLRERLKVYHHHKRK